MSIEQGDLDLLLSLQDKVLETPPPSPPTSKSPDHGPPRRSSDCDMSVFRDSVEEYLEDVPTVVIHKPTTKPNHNHPNDVHVDRFSGLRIRNPSVSTEDLNFSDTRFIRLPAIRNLLLGDSVTGCWATAAVLTETGAPRLSSTGNNYCIWKIGCLDEKLVSVFLFGDAYTKNHKQKAGMVFAFFNANVRKDAKGNGFYLSVFSSDQILKMGTSVDYGICKAKRKDGVPCGMVINKCRGIYCNYHKSNASQKYSTVRTELKGGNLKTAFRDTQRLEGIYMVAPLSERTNTKKLGQPMKLLSVDGLKKALSNAGKVTTNARSQGIRFLTEVTGKTCPRSPRKGFTLPDKEISGSGKRLSSSTKLASTGVGNKMPEAKRRKPEQSAEKMIELEVFSSDEE